MRDNIIRFRDQDLRAQVDHGGVGMVFANRAGRKADGLNCHFIDCVVVPPGSSIGLHTHSHDNEELYVILKGRGIMTIEDDDRDVEPGDVIINPPGGTHGLRNPGKEDIELVVIEYAADGDT